MLIGTCRWYSNRYFQSYLTLVMGCSIRLATGNSHLVLYLPTGTTECVSVTVTRSRISKQVLAKQKPSTHRAHDEWVLELHYRHWRDRNLLLDRFGGPENTVHILRTCTLLRSQRYFFIMSRDNLCTTTSSPIPLWCGQSYGYR